MLHCLSLFATQRLHSSPQVSIRCQQPFAVPPSPWTGSEWRCPKPTPHRNSSTCSPTWLAQHCPLRIQPIKEPVDRRDDAHHQWSQNSTKKTFRHYVNRCVAYSWDRKIRWTLWVWTRIGCCSWTGGNWVWWGMWWQPPNSGIRTTRKENTSCHWEHRYVWASSRRCMREWRNWPRPNRGTPPGCWSRRISKSPISSGTPRWSAYNHYQCQESLWRTWWMWSLRSWNSADGKEWCKDSMPWPISTSKPPRSFHGDCKWAWEKGTAWSNFWSVYKGVRLGSSSCAPANPGHNSARV